MQVTAVKTPLIRPGSIELLPLLDQTLPALSEGSVVAITSKIISLCENNAVPVGAIDKERLIIQESNRYLPAAESKFGHHFTIVNNTLIGAAGIDESNGDGCYILWPKDAQATANHVRRHVKAKFGLEKVGVLITDSTSHPLRRGSTGIMLAYSGFRALNNYVGTQDLFGHTFAVSQADISGGLAAAAVLAMGEGTEQTPIAILSDLPFVTFEDHDPTATELAEIMMTPEDDLFVPFLLRAPWQDGKRRQS